MSKSSELSRMKTVSRNDVIRTVAIQKGCSVELSKEIIELFLNEIVDELAKGNRIEFRHFGSFSPMTYKGSPTSRNPRTGESLGPSKDKKTAKFKSSKRLKKALNVPKL